jgi:ATPase family associated with various cellular activities (AAA)
VRPAVAVDRAEEQAAEERSAEERVVEERSAEERSAEERAAAAWREANRRALMAEVATVRAFLAGDAPAAEEAPDEASALDAVCACFGLSAFERSIVVLCAAPELDGSFGTALAAASGGATPVHPTFGLALASLPEAHWSALSPWGPLRHWRLVEPGTGLLTTVPLRIDEWLLHVLVGAAGLDRRLAPLVRRLESPGPVPASAGDAVDAVVAAWRRAGPGGPVVLRGGARQSKRAIFAEACRRLGWRAYAAHGTDLPADPTARDELLRLWEREALLDPAALMIEGDESDHPGDAPTLARFVDRLATPAAVAVGEGDRAGPGAGVVVNVGRPSATEQRDLWARALGDTGGFESLNGSLDRVVAQFDLDPDAIEAAARRAQGDGRDTAPDPGQRVWEACRLSARGGLDDLAQRLESTACFDDLVLPAAQHELLRDIVAHVRHRAVVYETWGMAGPTRTGLGISALFSGPSGTGKTLAACVLANEFNLDLYRIDLSQVVSKYIGETEKNLRRIFAAAAGSGAVLLFDEADALFGKRSEVRDSHDRYANVEVSYLLQAMESYRGLAVLTTNMRSALDPAFLRRLRFVVTFPFPGAGERSAIWVRAFPPATPTRDLDPAKLAQLEVAGGTIRSIALHAAFAAAEAGGPVGMDEVLRAAAVEYAKMERALSDAEVQGWS